MSLGVWHYLAGGVPTVFGLIKGVAWTRDAVRKRDAAIAAEAESKAARYAEEKAHRERVESALDSASDRLEAVEVGLATVGKSVARLEGRLDTHDLRDRPSTAGGQGGTGVSGVALAAVK